MDQEAEYGNNNINSDYPSAKFGNSDNSEKEEKIIISSKKTRKANIYSSILSKKDNQSQNYEFVNCNFNSNLLNDNSSHIYDDMHENVYQEILGKKQDHFFYFEDNKTNIVRIHQFPYYQESLDINSRIIDKLICKFSPLQ